MKLAISAFTSSTDLTCLDEVLVGFWEILLYALTNWRTYPLTRVPRALLGGIRYPRAFFTVTCLLNSFEAVALSSFADSRSRMCSVHFIDSSSSLSTR